MTLEEMLGLYPTQSLQASTDYLRQVGKMPTLAPWSGRYNGAYRSGTNEVEVNPYQSPASMKNTLAHEVGHAADTALADQRFGILRQNGRAWLPSSRPSPTALIFAAGFDKLSPYTNKLKTGYENARPETKAYRTSSRELRAFGAGNAADPAPAIYPGAPHLDTTMATEFEILLDLARRAQRNP